MKSMKCAWMNRIKCAWMNGINVLGGIELNVPELKVWNVPGWME